MKELWFCSALGMKCSTPQSSALLCPHYTDNENYILKVPSFQCLSFSKNVRGLHSMWKSCDLVVHQGWNALHNTKVWCYVHIAPTMKFYILKVPSFWYLSYSSGQVSKIRLTWESCDSIGHRGWGAVLCPHCIGNEN
jgi:hypothetical protein